MCSERFLIFSTTEFTDRHPAYANRVVHLSRNVNFNLSHQNCCCVEKYLLTMNYKEVAVLPGYIDKQKEDIYCFSYNGLETVVLIAGTDGAFYRIYNTVPKWFAILSNSNQISLCNAFKKHRLRITKSLVVELCSSHSIYDFSPSGTCRYSL